MLVCLFVGPFVSLLVSWLSLGLSLVLNTLLICVEFRPFMVHAVVSSHAALVLRVALPRHKTAQTQLLMQRVCALCIVRFCFDFACTSRSMQRRARLRR
jgi:uncharacterized membrane protein YqaE (UPF0057 family)